MLSALVPTSSVWPSITAVVLGYLRMKIPTLSIFSSASRCTVFLLISNWMSRMLQYCWVFATTGTMTSTGARPGRGRRPAPALRRRCRLRRGLRAAERVDQADQQHVDVALVADRVVHAVALPLRPQPEGRREIVLDADAVLVVALRSSWDWGWSGDGGASAGAGERVLGLGVGQADPAKSGELLRHRQNADRIQVQALELGRLRSRFRSAWYSP